MVEEKKTPLVEFETHVFIDASNIRSACLKTLGFMIDFAKLLDYFKKKYPNLKEVRYYEGIANGDAKKQRIFDFLEQEGYAVCPLERKTYISADIERREMKCPACGNRWMAEILRERKVMKSNVDVYLATELLRVAHFAERETHIVLVSCDGDYAEMIESAIGVNEKVTISVLGTPVVRNNRNTFSMKLQRMRGKVNRFIILDISHIRDLICGDIKKEKISEGNVS